MDQILLNWIWCSRHNAVPFSITEKMSVSPQQNKYFQAPFSLRVLEHISTKIWPMFSNCQHPHVIGSKTCMSTVFVLIVVMFVVFMVAALMPKGPGHWTLGLGFWALANDSPPWSAMPAMASHDGSTQVSGLETWTLVAPNSCYCAHGFSRKTCAFILLLHVLYLFDTFWYSYTLLHCVFILFV